MDIKELITSYEKALDSIKHSDKKEAEEVNKINKETDVRNNITKEKEKATPLKKDELYNFIKSEARNMLVKNKLKLKEKLKTENKHKLNILTGLFALKDALDTLQRRQNQSIILNEIMKTSIKDKEIAKKPLI